MHVVISDVQHVAFYDLCQQISPKVHKFLSFAFKKLFSCIVHILKTQLVSMYHQLYFLPPLSVFMHTFGTKSYTYIYISHSYIYQQLTQHYETNTYTHIKKSNKTTGSMLKTSHCPKKIFFFKNCLCVSTQKFAYPLQKFTVCVFPA